MNAIKTAIILVLFICFTAAGRPAIDTGLPEVEPEADKLLQKMSSYLSGLERFSVQAENIIEVVVGAGEKIQFIHPASLSVQRPNKMYAERRAVSAGQTFYYDGETLTLHDKGQNYFASVDAPPTIEESLDLAAQHLGLFAPAGDLLYRDPYKVLMSDVFAGMYVGMSIVGNRNCHHLIFFGNEVDWQIWIEDGDQPLPKKFVITSKWITGAPQFTVTMNSWDLNPKFDDGLFKFTPSTEAQKIDFLR